MERDLQKRDSPTQEAKQAIKQTKPIIPIISQPTYKPAETQNNNSSPLHSEIQRYKQDYLHLLQENQVLQAHLSKVIREKEQLERKFNNTHHHCISSEKSENEEKKKRHRRVASEIARDYVCPNQKCGKSYGTDASLVQHIKLKHVQFFESALYQEFISEIRKNKDKSDKKTERIPLNCLETENKNANS